MSKRRKSKRVAKSSGSIGKKRAKATAEKRHQTASKKRLARKKLNNKLKLSGALEWLLPMMETAYTPLVPRGAAGPQGRPMQISSLKQLSRAVLDPAVPTMWKDAILEYKRRKAAAVTPTAARPAVAPSSTGRDWLPLGPSVVLNGQTIGNQPVGGRVSGLAIARGGSLVYAASANGGVFRSGDGGTTWLSLMDRFDLDPTNFASACVVCGAIALDSSDPNRIYVGTGEGDTYQLFQVRIAHALPAYRGVGPIRSDDGGASWIPEPSTPDLAGQAFFGLAVDPGNRENVIAATTNGLYRRVPKLGATFEWVQLKTGVYSSAVATEASGKGRFYAGQWGDPQSPSGVYYSDDQGATWAPAGTGLPTNDAGRIAIGVQPTNSNLAYALIAKNSNGGLLGLFRLDGVTKSWKQVSNVPDVLPLWQGQSQGGYDLAIAVDPSNSNLVYIGGSYANADPWPGSIWRCPITTVGAGYKVTGAGSIGTHAHSDIHVLVHTPGDPNELWCGCDGGVFLNRDVKGTGEFVSQNNGLACLCCNFMGQHPTDPNILFTGLQDNGTARTASGPIWTHVQGGDGGYCLINWTNPDLVLVFANGTVYRSTTGGTSESSWSTEKAFSWSTMTQPIVSPRYDPTKPADANLVAIGDGQTVFLSEDFANSWPTQFTLPGNVPDNDVFALAFGSRDRLFIGTTLGQVFKADRAANNRWSVTRLDDVAVGPLGLTGLISDIAVDWGDPAMQAIYITFGGKGDDRRVWRFDGTKWETRSGAVGVSHLLDVEHNALAIDWTAPNNLYVGADIGVWHSPDAGANWKPLENGLPEAPVFDVQIHPTQRLLRAALHDRGVYELSII